MQKTAGPLLFSLLYTIESTPSPHGHSESLLTPKEIQFSFLLHLLIDNIDKMGGGVGPVTNN
jgi:hypothetical protein